MYLNYDPFWWRANMAIYTPLHLHAYMQLYTLITGSHELQLLAPLRAPSDVWAWQQWGLLPPISSSRTPLCHSSGELVDMENRRYQLSWHNGQQRALSQWNVESEWNVDNIRTEHRQEQNGTWTITRLSANHLNNALTLSGNVGIVAMVSLQK